MRSTLLVLLAITISCTTKQREDPKMSEQVKTEFLHAWNGYKEHAWGMDALKPLSKSGKNWYDASLLMTPVDAFDTMLLMGLEDEAAETKELIFSELSFDQDFFVSNFEITIRLLGGLLSAYEMDGDERFLELAEDLGNRLLPAFDSKTGMTYGRVNLQSGETKLQVNNPAEIGTLMLEFGTLTKHTEDSVFYNSAKKAMLSLYEHRSEIDLVGTTIDVETGEWQNKEAHISGMIDSYYEYALKAWLLFKDEDFKKIWDTHEPALEKYLLDEVASGTWYGRADMDTGKRTATTYGALDAFMPGLLVLAGDIKTAKKVQESNFKMWQLHGIEPEGIDYSDMSVNYAAYFLRPENIESAYYLYKATGDEKYREMGKTMFNSLVTYCRTETGYAALADVTTMEKSDDMESFFLAETLKYAYLLFADDNVFDLDKHVFNTEAHPLKIES